MYLFKDAWSDFTECSFLFLLYTWSPQRSWLQCKVNWTNWLDAWRESMSLSFCLLVLCKLNYGYLIHFHEHLPNGTFSILDFTGYEKNTSFLLILNSQKVWKIWTKSNQAPLMGKKNTSIGEWWFHAFGIYSITNNAPQIIPHRLKDAVK